jgi:methylated-DNA-[protein]-cysteine S-methyltransferase
MCAVEHEFQPSELSMRAAEMLQTYYSGERVDFSDLPVDLGTLPPFRQKVLNAVRSLRYGDISTYGQVAFLCESPRAARAVGGALASNPIPVVIPCHRVVAADGGLTGFSAPGGTDTKRTLLKMEGAEFKGEQHVTNQVVMHKVP